MESEKEAGSESQVLMGSAEVASCPRFFADTVLLRADGKTMVLTFGVNATAFGGDSGEAIPEMVVFSPVGLARSLHEALTKHLKKIDEMQEQ